MSWAVVAVELGVCAGVLALLLADTLFGAKRRHALWKPALAGLAVLGGILWWQQPWIGQAFEPVANGRPMFVLDQFAWTFKWLFLLTMAAVILMTRVFTAKLTDNVGEFYLLLYSALLGMLVLASVNDLLLLFIGLEILTFSLYIMAAYLRTDTRSIEAGMKYLIMGSVSSGFLVYGISLLYGASGGTDFTTLRDAFASGMPLIAKAGMLLVLAGLGFKIAAVPFHLWVPDVYQGAPSPVVALLSVGSKMAGFVALMRVLYSVFWPAQEAWGQILAVLAGMTLLYGNLAAIPQTNIKRLLGYSSIGHAGYLLMGLSTAGVMGAQAVGYYLLAYMVSNLAVFFVVVVVSKAAGDELEDYDGLANRSPLLAAVLFIGLLSLAGVPPLAGFAGKLLVLLAAVQDGRMWLVGIGAAMVAVSLYYYLMVVRRMYLRQPSSAAAIHVDGLTRLALFVLLGGILAIGIVQEPFLRVFSSAIRF